MLPLSLLYSARNRSLSNFYGVICILFLSLTMQVRRTWTGKLSTRQGCSCEIASLVAQEITKLVGSKRSDRVMIVGCEHIELLIQLAHQGFVDVTCRAALAGPNAGEMPADIIVAPAVHREPKLAALLSRLERGLRPDGVLLLGTAGAGLTTQVRQIRRFLIQHGFTFVRMHLEPADVHILCCRKVPALQAQAA